MHWIKVSEEKPEDFAKVMVTVRNKKDPGFVDIMCDVMRNPNEDGGWCYDDGADCLIYIDDMEVTHWMRRTAIITILAYAGPAPAADRFLGQPGRYA